MDIGKPHRFFFSSKQQLIVDPNSWKWFIKTRCATNQKHWNIIKPPEQDVLQTRNIGTLLNHQNFH